MKAQLMNSTGKLVDVMNITKEDVSSEVIIFGACRINRFLGQTAYPYSVAAHLIAGYQYLCDIGADLTMKKQWLIHEAYESYTGVDLPTPLKRALPAYKEAENRALYVIAEAFGVDPATSDLISELDKAIAITEAVLLMPNSVYWYDFATSNNIKPLESRYVLSKGKCNEDYLYEELSSIWKEVFGTL